MIVFLLFSIIISAFVSCKSKGVQETLEQRTIREGKSYASPEPNLFSSSNLKFLLKNFPEIASNLYSISSFYFPEKLTQSYSLQDVYSFFQFDNIWISLDRCLKSGCPKLDCQVSQDGVKSITKINAQGECFNEIFDFSGKIAFEDVFSVMDSDFYVKYNMDLRDWSLRGVLTDERVFYFGSVSFVSERIGNRNSIERKISIKGNSFVGKNKKEEPINFDHEFLFLEMGNGSTRTILSQLVDYRNKFCFARTSGYDYIFSCDTSYQVEKILSVFQDGRVYITGNMFLIYGKDKVSWFEINFSIGFTTKPCNFISGSINFLSGDETLILEYRDKYYTEENCNFLCPTNWIWKKRDNQTQGVGCLP